MGDQEQAKLTRRRLLGLTAGLGLTTMASRWHGFSLTASPAGAAPAPQKPSRLTMIWHIVNNQDVRFKPVLTRFQADTGVDVNFIRVPNIEQVTEKVLAMFAAGEDFDVADPTLGAGAAFVREGVIRPLDGLPGLEQHLEEMIPSIRPLLQFDGRTWAVPQWIASACGAYNMRLFEKGRIAHPPRTWEEVREVCLKAKRDGLAKFPLLFPSGVGVDHGQSVWYALVATVGGTITDKSGNPTLGPGSKAREMLEWLRKSYVEWQIADPRGLELRYYPAAKAYATGDYLMLLGIRQTFFTAINGGDSPTIGQHALMLLPGGKTMISVEYACIGATSKHPQWAWQLLQYLVGRTPNGELLGPKQMAREVLTPYPIASMTDPEVNKLYRQLFSDLDAFKESLNRSLAHNVVTPAVLMPWWTKWQDAVNAILQDTLRGKLSADRACDNMTAAARRLQGR